MTKDKDNKVSSKTETTKTTFKYDMNSNDNPGNIITQVQLKGDNYEEWARVVWTSLRARRKWGFIEGTAAMPNTASPEIEDWWIVQSMLISWIMNTIGPSLRTTVTYTDTAKGLWDDLKERFSVINRPRIQQLTIDLTDCKQQGMTIVAYYSKLKTLWDDLAIYEPLLVCTCTGCECKISEKL